MTDREIIDEAVRLVDEGLSVKLPVSGISMLPFIVGGRDSVILSKIEHPTAGDVVLAWVEGRRYVLHRVINIADDQVTLMGDGNIAGTESCTVNDIKALATHVIRDDGKERDLYSLSQRIAARLWQTVRPIRKYLLAIYRRL